MIGSQVNPEEPQEPQSGMTVGDAIELLHDIHKSPVMGKLTAREVVELKKLSREKWQSVWTDYYAWVKQSRLIPNWAYTLIFIVSLLGYWYWRRPWILIGALVGVIEQVGRYGETEGYRQGYEAGFESGVNRGLGLSDRESADIDEMALDAEVWSDIDIAGLRNRADEKQRSSSETAGS